MTDILVVTYMSPSPPPTPPRASGGFAKLVTHYAWMLLFSDVLLAFPAVTSSTSVPLVVVPVHGGRCSSADYCLLG